MSSDIEKQTVSYGLFQRTLKEMADMMIEAVRGSAKRIEELEKRLAALEAKPSLNYLGVFDSTKHYPAGSAVTRAGALWIAKTDTSTTPGDSGHWQLAVRKGAA